MLKDNKNSAANDKIQERLDSVQVKIDSNINEIKAELKKRKKWIVFDCISCGNKTRAPTNTNRVKSNKCKKCFGKTL